MIVITGGAGFIGSVLAWNFNQTGRKNLLLVDQNAKKSPKWKNVEKRSFEDYLEHKDFIERLEAGQFNGKIEAIFHMGACSDTTETNRQYLRETNSRYSERVAAWAVRNGVYLLYASSAATYGGGEESFSDRDALTETLKPLNPYGASKLDFDRWVLKNGYDKKITGLRFFNVYGPNEYHKGEMRSMVHKGFEQVRDTGKIRLFKSYKPDYADGEQKRDFVYVKDVVEVMYWFFKNPRHKGIYNLGSGRAESWNELARSLFTACEKKLKIEYFDMPEALRNQYQYFTEAELSKLKGILENFSFKPLKEGVADYVKRHLLADDPYL